jgi:hypothetical protein
MGLSTGFLKTVESVKQTLLFRRAGGTNAATMDIFAKRREPSAHLRLTGK